MPLTPGSRLGPYDIAGKIGAGGMGEVYRARDARLGRDVALKILPDAFARDPDRLARFEREARALAALNHPNIAQIHGLEEAGGTRALVLEFVDGPTLADRLQRGPLEMDEALAIARQIALALEAAHDLGIVHRDLKPANVKVRSDGTVKVLDFGLAKALDARTDSGMSPGAELPTVTSPAMTGIGVILGTAAYMSPEQARGRPVDRRADIWAFGCVLYEMLSGRRAFHGDDVSTTLAAVLKDSADMTALSGDVPPSLRRLLRRCLEKDPKNRLSAIGDARLELDERDEIAVTNSPPARRAIVMPLLIAAALGAAVTAAATWLLSRPGGTAAASPQRLSILPPRDLEFVKDSAASVISPDGRWIAFVTSAFGPVDSQLWVREVGSLTARKIEGAEDAYLPFWSPRSDRIGFFAKKKLNTVAVDGGRIHTVCDAVDGRGGTWNAADVIVFAESAASVLKRVPAGGGDPAPVTALDAAKNESGHRYPQFLPDGGHFLLTALPPVNNKYRVSVGALDSPQRSAIGEFENAPVFAPSGHLLFMRRGVLVAQAFDPSTRTVSGEIKPLDDTPGLVGAEWNGSPAVSVTSAGALLYVNDPQPNTQLAWMDVQSGKVTSRLQLPPAFYSDPSVSPDGRSAVVRRNDTPTTSSLWLLDLASGVDLQPVTLAASRNYAQRWSFDGKRLFFTSDREGIEQIFVKDIGSSAAERVLFRTPALFKQARSVSPDGKWLIFQELTDQTDIWMFSLTGDDKPQPLLRTPADESDPSVSPDGRWLSYTSNKSGRSEVYVDAFPHGGREVQITTEGGFGSAWHQNGRQLMTDNERGIFVQDLIIGAEVRRGQRRRLPLEEFRGMYGADVNPALQRALVALAKEGSTRTSLIYVTGWDAKLPRRR